MSDISFINSTSPLGAIKRISNIWHICRPVYDEFFVYVRQEEDTRDDANWLTPFDWQKHVPELIVAMVEFHLGTIRPHGAVDMRAARELARCYLPQSPQRDLDFLIRCSKKSVLEKLALPEQGIRLDCDVSKFPIITCLIFDASDWDKGVFDDTEDGMRSYTNLSISSTALQTERRYCWFEFRS